MVDILRYKKTKEIKIGYPNILSSFTSVIHCSICLFQGLLQQLVPFHQFHRKVIILILKLRFPVPEQLIFQIGFGWSKSKFWFYEIKAQIFTTQRMEFAQSITQDFQAKKGAHELCKFVCEVYWFYFVILMLYTVCFKKLKLSEQFQIGVYLLIVSSRVWKQSFHTMKIFPSILVECAV